jgi:hypothetical protein
MSRYTSTPVECGHCHNKTIMVVATSYSQVQCEEDSRTEEPFECGDIYDLLECPVCHKITLRKYFWADHMESEVDVTYHLLYPSQQDYTASSERFFPPNTEHDAYVRVREIVHEAKKSLNIIDPYTDGTVFTLLATIKGPLQVKILTAKTGGADFALEAKKFRAQYPQFGLEVRLTREFHDRFIILDNSKCYHLGSSVKDAGTKVCMIGLVEDTNNVKALLRQQEESWNAASALLT